MRQSKVIGDLLCCPTSVVVRDMYNISLFSKTSDPFEFFVLTVIDGLILRPWNGAMVLTTDLCRNLLSELWWIYTNVFGPFLGLDLYMRLQTYFVSYTDIILNDKNDMHF
jgi:hypothetical protein